MPQKKRTRNLTREERSILSGLLVVNKIFRETFLRDPARAAAAVGIILPPAYASEVKRKVKQLRAAALAGAQAIRVSTKGGIIPGAILD